MKDERQNSDQGRYRPYSLGAVMARFSCVLLVVAMTGCASLGLDPEISDAVRIERIDSPQARIGSVQVRDHEGQLAVSGRLQKRHHGRSPIPGHLHIEALAQDGAVLGQAVTSYRRLSPKLGISEFTRRLPVAPDRVRIVRVVHHHRDDVERDSGRPSPFGSSSQAKPTLANEPPLIFAGKFTAALDTGQGMKVMELLKRVVRGRNSPIVAVTHDVRMIAGFDSLYHMDDGRLRRT